MDTMVLALATRAGRIRLVVNRINKYNLILGWFVGLVS